MFYLLEDNRIIDTNELLNSGIQISIKKSQKFKVVYLVGWFGERFFGTIKKQSENVYDLIDWGQDLVRVDDNIFCCKYFYSKEEYLTNKWFNAIYKPNSKGDYIKVWEKKDG